MQLRQLQQDLQSHLMNGGDGILRQIVDSAPLSRQARLNIYRNAYVNRLREALRANFVKLHRVLGDDVFASAAAGFIAAHPSTTRSIRWFGRHFSEFLARTAPYEAQPILVELARFEWALSEVFDAGEEPVLSRELLLRIAPERWGNLSFKFHPSVRTLSLEWNTVSVWQALDADGPVPPPQKSAQRNTWLMWRQDLKNQFRSLDVAEATALAWAMDGAPFATVCEHLRPTLAEEQIPLRAAVLVGAWADSGILIAGSENGADLP